MAKYKTKGAAEAAAKRNANRARNLDAQIAEVKKKARESIAKAKAKLTGDAGQRAAIAAGGGGLGGVLVQGVMHLAGRYAGSAGITGQVARTLGSPTAAGALVGVVGGGLALAAEGKPKRKMMGDLGLGMVSAGAGFAIADQAARFLPAAPPVAGLFTQAMPYAPPVRYLPPPAPMRSESYDVAGIYQGEPSAFIAPRHQLQ